MAPVRVVSVSGGKDSQATALLCLERHPDDAIRFVFFDTGNEHPLTYAHLDYLRQQFNRPIETLRADFTREIAAKRDYVLAHWPAEGIADEVVQRAIAALVPTGIPFLDLCIWKGRFPSRKAQFCTQELKRYVSEAYMLDLMSQGYHLESWQGVRRDESTARKDVLDQELTPEGWLIVRPIAAWTAQQTVDYCLARGTRLNPLYSLGMNRVGCMPCINTQKDELQQIDARFPEVIDKVRAWEECVGAASKRGAASFFAAPDKDGRGAREGRNIDERVTWSKTARGGKQFDLLKAAPPSACSSSYGLCE